MAVDLIIKNGTVVTAEGAMKIDVAIAGEKIAALGLESALPKAERVIDGKGKIVIPGGVDAHSHIEYSSMGVASPETWDVATIAAAIGGTTTTIDFASRNKGESLLDAIKRQLARAEKLSVIDYTTKSMLVNVTDLDQVIADMKEVVDYGIPAFKAFMIFSKKGFFVDDWQLYAMIRHCKEIGGMVTVHAENCLIGENMQAELVKQGKTNTRYHGVARPNFVEDMAIYACMEMTGALNARAYIVHASTKDATRIIDSYRKKGLAVFCETCTHYLWLTDSLFEPKFPRGIFYMGSPPLRKHVDIEVLWEGIKNGTVHTVGSDHCAFTMKQKEENSASFMTIPNGFPGIEVRVPVVFSEGVVKRGVSLEKFVNVVSTNVAKLFGIYPQKGVIARGSDADIVIIDPQKRHSLNATDLHMGTDLSVYEGLSVIGWPVMVILRGKVIVENEKFVGKPAQGKFVKGKLDDTIMATV